MIFSQELFLGMNKDPYVPGTTLILETSNTGEKQVNLEKGIYKIECIGSGSGGNGWYIASQGYIFYGGGGSGAGFVGEFSLPKGLYKYRGSNGGGGNGGAGQESFLINVDTNFGVSSGGGGNGWYTKFDGNTGGILSIREDQIIGIPQVKTNGNTGAGGGAAWGDFPGGPSVYNSFGAGGNSRGGGGGGYLKVTYLRLK